MKTENMRNGRANLRRGTGKPQFLYKQLAEILRGDIESEKFQPGDMLPSMDDLSRQYEINKATVRQAVLKLTAEGCVYTVPAKGTFVSEKHKPASRPSMRTLSIGWISSVSDEGNTGRYHTEMMDAVRGAVQERGGHLLVFSTNDTSPANLLKSVGKAGLDGAVLIGPAQQEPLRQLINGRLPTVLINDKYRGKQLDTILVNDEAGGHQAVEHLISLGHRRLALVTGPQDWQVTRDRLIGARTAMEAVGIRPSEAYTVEADFSPAGGARAIKQILKRRPHPTGVFFFNDEMAAGALQALYENSALQVPRDLSFVGYDNVLWATLTHPPLTTIHVEKALMGHEAVKRLCKNIQGDKHIPTTTILPTRLIVRKSTGPAPDMKEQS